MEKGGFGFQIFGTPLGWNLDQIPIFSIFTTSFSTTVSLPLFLVFSKVSLTSPMPGAPLPTTPPVAAPVREAPRPEQREHRPSGSLVVLKNTGGRIGEGKYSHTSTGKKREIFFNSPFLFSCAFFVRFHESSPTQKAASGIDLSAFEAQIQQLEVQRGLDVGYRQRLFGVAKPQGFDGSQLTNINGCGCFLTQTEVSAMISLSVFLFELYKCAAGVLDFLFFVFQFHEILGRFRESFYLSVFFFAASNFFCWKQTGRWGLV